MAGVSALRAIRRSHCMSARSPGGGARVTHICAAWSTIGSEALVVRVLDSLWLEEGGDGRRKEEVLRRSLISRGVTL